MSWLEMEQMKFQGEYCECGHRRSNHNYSRECEMCPCQRVVVSTPSPMIDPSITQPAFKIGDRVFTAHADEVAAYYETVEGNITSIMLPLHHDMYAYQLDHCAEPLYSEDCLRHKH